MELSGKLLEEKNSVPHLYILVFSIHLSILYNIFLFNYSSNVATVSQIASACFIFMVIFPALGILPVTVSQDVLLIKTDEMTEKDALW